VHGLIAKYVIRTHKSGNSDGFDLSSLVEKDSMQPTYILGVSAFYHDSVACLVRDGEIVAAAQEERFTRKKHDSGFPLRAIHYCLREGGVSLTNLKYIVFYDKPLVKFERLLGKDPMLRKFERNIDTYRVIRQPRPSSHMKHQF
jgi:predicted NodU family carbamoyl transferase